MIKKYQRTQNLISMDMLSDNTNMNADGVMYAYNGRVGTNTDIDVSNLNSVTVSVDLVGKTNTLYFIYAIFNGTTLINRVAGNLSGTSINTTNATNLRLCFYINNESIDKSNLSNLMLNEGSTAKPYQPYYDWLAVPYKRYVNGEWVEYNDQKYHNGSWD